ncbi:MAG TPA: histidinol-phosphate transaminase [Candidatus Binataceae bacterium]|nr:histidinol-phosphate transaminase [Candidatus Binataceae bacterium]
MFRDVIERMAPYVPGEQPRPGQRLIKLNTNENPYPPSPAVRQAVARAAAGGSLRLYPPPDAGEFVAAAARLYGFRPRMILAGNGSDELLAMLFRAALGAGATVAYPVPTYSLYETLATMQEARVVTVPFGVKFELPVDSLARLEARLTIVCSPNSPSGTNVSRETLDALARRLKNRLLVIDEAYVDFADENALDLARRHSNVVVLRTLSKSFSLAGMRLGLCFAHPSIIEALGKVKDSYNLSRLAVVAGAAALDDAAWMRRNVERVRRTRAATEKRLRKLGFEVPPSSANFVFARLAGRDLAPMGAALRRRGILVRHFPGSSFADALRISIGTPAEMAALFKALAPLVRGHAASKRNGRAESNA